MKVGESIGAGTEWAGWAYAHPKNNLGGNRQPWIFIP